MTKPEQVFKAGAVRASIFKNVIHRDGKEVPIRKVVLEVRYKDKNGEWKGTNSLSLNEVPKAVTALQQAYAYLVSDSGRDEEFVAAGDGTKAMKGEFVADEFSPIKPMKP